MARSILFQFLLEADNDAGKLKNMLHIRGAHENTHDNGTVAGHSVANAIFKVLLDIITRIIYVLVFMYLPYRIFSKISIWEGFQLRQSVVYFTCFLSCICGSLINSGMFDMDEDMRSLFVTMQVDASVFFKERIVYKLIVDGLGFGIAYCMIGMDFGHAFYLALWVLISRLIGELINLYVFRYVGKAISELTIVTISVMGTCVFMAYAFPFLRNRVVDLTSCIYNYVWILTALILAAVALYVLFNYTDYGYIVQNYMEDISYDNTADGAAGTDDGMMISEYSKKGYFRRFDKDTAKGLEYLHKIFFIRNLDFIRSILSVRCILIIIAGVVGVIICCMSPENTKNTIWSVLCDAMPIMVFIMYCLSVTPKLCKSMFCYIDRDILESGTYTTKRYNFLNYCIRLKMLAGCELIQAVVLCAAFIAVAIATGNGRNMAAIIPVCLGIVMLSVFYAVFNLLVYYICQPYTKELKMRGYTFFAAHAGILCLCYGCVYIDCTAFVFDMFLAIVLAFMLSISATLVYYFSDKTFYVK